jgi:hypothetical protein
LSPKQAETAAGCPTSETLGTQHEKAGVRATGEVGRYP